MHIEFVWLNGDYVPRDMARVSPFDRGFLYGDGLFETLRAQHGRVLALTQHLARLTRSAATLRLVLPAMDWEAVITELLVRNALPDRIARVKVIVTRGTARGQGLPTASAPTVCITAEPCDPPCYTPGYRLHLFTDFPTSPLAGHKTLNYLFFRLAQQSAIERGMDDAVLTDPDGMVTETSTGNILLHARGLWSTPQSAYRLRGITLDQTIALMAHDDLTVMEQSIEPEDLHAAETIWVLNAWIGIMPVYTLEERVLPDGQAEYAARLRIQLGFD